MNSNYRKITLAGFTCLIVLGTSYIFHVTQSYDRYAALIQKNFDKRNFSLAVDYAFAILKIQPNDTMAIQSLFKTYKVTENIGIINRLARNVEHNNEVDENVLLRMGDIYYSLDNYASAEILYKKVVGQNDYSIAKKRLAEVLMWQKKYSDAIVVLEEIIQAYPGDHEKLQLLADAYFYEKNFHKSVLLYAQLTTLQDRKENADKWQEGVYQMARENLSVKQYDRAEQNFLMLSKASPIRDGILDGLFEVFNHTHNQSTLEQISLLVFREVDSKNATFLRLADSYYSLNDYANAEKYYSEYLKYHDEAGVKKRLAEVLLWQKKENEGVVILEGWVALNPNDVKSIELLAETYKSLGYYEKALSQYSILINKKHSVKSNLEKHQNVLYLSAIDAISIKNFDLATKKFKAGLLRNNSDIRMFDGVFNVYTMTKNEQYVEGLKEHLLINNIRNEEYFLRIADLYYSKNNFLQAEQMYIEVLKINEKKFDAQKRLAEVLVWQEKFDEALPKLEQLVKDNFNDVSLIQLLADIYSWQKQYVKAVARYEQLVNAEYNMDDNLLKLAENLRFAKKDKEAVEVYNRYLERRKGSEK